MIERRFAISAIVAVGEKKPPDDTMTGNAFVGPYDAAKNYAGLYLPGYSMISVTFQKVQDTKAHGLHSLYKAQLINHERRLGADLYVREL